VSEREERERGRGREGGTERKGGRERNGGGGERESLTHTHTHMVLASSWRYPALL